MAAVLGDTKQCAPSPHMYMKLIKSVNHKIHLKKARRAQLESALLATEVKLPKFPPLSS